MTYKSNNMSRPVRRSTSTDEQGRKDPNSITAIADAQVGGKARVIGFMYRGNGYGKNSAWITCKKSDLVNMHR